jgi:molybdopterin-containing oxidoreductase family membrane subunit
MASDVKVKKSLPQGVGKFTPRWIMFTVAATIVLILGVLAYLYEANQGMIVTGMANTGTQGGVTWGLYVVMVEYFIGVSLAGIVLASFAKVFRVKALRPISRLAVLLTVCSLVVGVLAVLIDLGKPIRGIINMLLYVRPQSPFFGTFMLVAVGVLLTSLVYLFLDGRRDAAYLADIDSGLRWYHRLWASGYGDTAPERLRHRRTMFWLSIFVVPLVVIALSTEGLVFGIQVGRPGWFGSLQGPDFLVLAAASGLANLIVLTAIVRKVLRDDFVLIEREVFRWMGGLLLAATAVTLYFQIVELFTLLYATPGSERQLADALLRGPYAWIFWLGLMLLVLGLALLIVQAVKREWNVGLLVVASVAISTAAVAERYLTVIPSQTHGMMLPYAPGSYFPTWVEFTVVAGLFALGALLIGLFIKVFPIVPLDGAKEEQEVLVDA